MCYAVENNDSIDADMNTTNESFPSLTLTELESNNMYYRNTLDRR